VSFVIFVVRKSFIGWRTRDGFPQKFAQKRSSMKISVANLIVRFLKAARVPYLFGLSGHSIFPITDAVYAEPDVRFIPVMHELSAAYMAAAYAKGTRTLGVCTASAGVGVTNLLTGIAYAYKESIPVIVVAADVARDHAGKGASSWHEMPQREIFEPITKMSVTLENANQTTEILLQAFTEATTEEKGRCTSGCRAICRPKRSRWNRSGHTNPSLLRSLSRPF